jgi:hypothetical protein
MSKFNLPKMGAKSAGSDSLPAWRADFRRKDELPDVKAVRTDFLVNYGLIGLAIISLTIVGVREFTYFGLQNEIDGLSAQIDVKRDQNVKNLKDSGSYSSHMKFVDAFTKFKATPVECFRVASELGLIKVGNMVIKNILIDSSFIDLKTKKEKVKVTVVGVSKGVAQANFSQVESAFEKFKTLPVWAGLKKYRIEPQKPVVVANTQDQVIDFTFELSLVGIEK